MTRAQPLRFGSFEFDPLRSVLRRDNVPVPLGRRAAALLGALVARRGEVLGKSELIDAAWPGVAVEEANLSVQIATLRRVLGPRPSGGEWITTVPRIGYRFAPAVETRPGPMRVPTLAILPFTDFGTGAQPEADGLAEDLTTALSRFRSIAVVARTVSFQRRDRYDDASRFGRRIGVDYVVEGSLRRSGEQVRINVKLIDATTGSHLWAQTFDQRGPAQGGADPVVNHIAALVEPQVQRAETTRSLVERPQGMSVYDLYLRARHLLDTCDESDNRVAYGLLHQALHKQPDNIHLLAAMSQALHHRVAVGWPPIGPDDRGEAMDMALRGLGLGVDDAAALALFSHAMFVAHEWDMGRLTMERAVAANPNSCMALTCAGQGALFLGDTAGAEDYYTRAFAMGPANPYHAHTLNGLAVVARRRGEYETAIELAKRAIAIRPSFSGSHWQLITATAYSGRLDEARRHTARYRAVSPEASVGRIAAGQPIVDERLLNHLLEGLAVGGLPAA